MAIRVGRLPLGLRDGALAGMVDGSTTTGVDFTPP
jgi:hypothetical protein